MAKTQIAGKQVLDGSIKLEDLDTQLSNTITELDSRVDAIEAGQVNVDLSGIEADISALDGRVDALEAVVPFSGSYNDLSDKPTIPSLTQVESDISALQGADVVLDSRVDALEAADVALDSRVDALEAADVALDSRLDSAESSLISLDGRVDALEAGGVSGGGSGAIEVFQDAQFTWSGSDTTRIITHNKGRQPDMVKVFVQNGSNIWIEHYDLSSPAGSGTNSGYYCLIPAADNNSTRIRLFNNGAGSSTPARIRLYWFGSNDVGGASAGAFSVGGVSPKYETTITHTGSDGGAVYTINHNLGTTDVKVAVFHPEGSGNNYAETINFSFAPDYSRLGFYVTDITTTSLKIRLHRWYPATDNSDLSLKQAKVIISKL